MKELNGLQCSSVASLRWASNALDIPCQTSTLSALGFGLKLTSGSAASNIPSKSRTAEVMVKVAVTDSPSRAFVCFVILDTLTSEKGVPARTAEVESSRRVWVNR